MPDLPELGARSANSFGEVAALPRAPSSRSVCSVGFLVASGTHLCKKGGSWGPGEKACAAALRGLWLQLLTQALFRKTDAIEVSQCCGLPKLTRLRKRRLGAGRAFRVSVGPGVDGANNQESGAPCTSCTGRCPGSLGQPSCCSGPGGARSRFWRGVSTVAFQTTTSTAHSPHPGGDAAS